jgi:2',5'-phosphodiesterase
VLQEILGFNADIICLQEVDEKAFQQFLQPHLDYAGIPTPSPLPNTSIGL